MAVRTIGLEIKIDGVSKTVTSIKELEGEIQNLQERLKGVAIGSDEFKRLQGELRAASGELEDFNKRSEGISLERQIEAVGKFTGGVTAGFAAATAAAELFGKETEGIQQAATTAQNLLTVALGARAAAETLVGARTLIQVASTKLATLATTAQSIATRGLTANLRALYATMLANPFTAVLAVVGALTAAFIAFSDSAEESSTKIQDLSDFITQDISNLIEYQKILNDTNSTEEQRRLIKERLVKLFPELNKQFDTQNRLTEKGNTLLTQRVQALILQEQIEQRLKQIAELRNKVVTEQNRNIDDEVQKTVKWYQSATTLFRNLTIERNKNLQDFQKQIQLLETDLQKLLTQQAPLPSLTTITPKERVDPELANTKRRIELIQNELEKSLENLKDAYEKERKEAKKNREDLTLVDDVYLQNKNKLFKDFYEKQFIPTIESLEKELNETVIGSYLIDEQNLIKSQNKRKREFEDFYESIQVIIEKNNKLTAEEQTNLLKQLGRIDNVLLKKNQQELNDLRLQSQIEGLKSIQEISEKFGQENLDNQIKLFNAEFDEFKRTELDKIKTKIQAEETLKILKGENRELTEKERISIEATARVEIRDYEKRLELLRKINIERLKLANEVTQAEKKSNEEVLQNDKQYFTDLLKLQETYKGDKERLDKEITNLDNQRKLRDLQTEKKLVDDKIRIYEKYNQDLNALNTRRAQLEGRLTTEFGGPFIEGITPQEDLAAIQGELNRVKKQINDYVAGVIDPVELEKLKNRALELQTAINTATNVKPADDSFQTALGNIQTYLQTFSNAINQISQISQQQFSMQLTNLESQYEKQIELLDELYQRNQNDAIAQERIEKKKLENTKIFEEKKKQIEKQARISSLQATLIQTIASAAQAVVTTLANPNLGPAAKAIIIGIEGLLATASIATIRQQIAQAQALRRGGKIKKQMATGGMVVGPSHEQGGVNFGRFELEGGEAVINRQSSLNYGGLLSSINESGGGRPIINNVLDSRLVEVLAKGRQEPIRAYVFESDITNAQTINRKLEQLTTL